VQWHCGNNDEGANPPTQILNYPKNFCKEKIQKIQNLGRLEIAHFG